MTRAGAAKDPPRPLFSEGINPMTHRDIQSTAAKPISTAFAAGAAAMLIASAVLLSSCAHAAPFRPTDDSEVLERLPVPDDAERQTLRRLRARLSGTPHDLTLALDLARRYLAVGRAEADPRYYGYAEAALEPWLGMAEPPVETLVLRAIIRQSQHAFDAAIDDLDRVLAVRPNHPQAQLSRAFVLQVLGRLDEAAESCRRLPSGIDRLIAATCHARVAGLTGRAAEARATLEDALANASGSESGLRLWALTNLAEIAARSGDAPAAERRFREAMALGLRDTYLLTAYADFLLDQGRHAEVRRLLSDEMRADGLLLRQVLAERALGDDGFEAKAATLAARFAEARQRGDARHLREEARFALQVRDDPVAALDLALENWRTQREPADARLVLEAAIASGMTDRAAETLRWLDKTGLHDVRLTGLAQMLRSGDVR